ncbi:MAG: hypothetical protein NVSMB47_00630 [Polyangiales bacterium]
MFLSGCALSSSSDGVEHPSDKAHATVESKPSGTMTETSAPLVLIAGDPARSLGPVRHDGATRYRAVTVRAQAGLTLDVWARSNDGDAIVWILTHDGDTVAMNDDADDAHHDAHVRATLPAGDGFYRVVFRESAERVASFTLALAVEYPRGRAGDAEQVYDRLVGTGADARTYAVPRGALPNPAQQGWEALEKLYAHPPTAWRLPLGADVVYAVADGAEELWQVRLYGAHGEPLATGDDGDSGPEVASWHAPKD